MLGVKYILTLTSLYQRIPQNQEKVSLTFFWYNYIISEVFIHYYVLSESFCA